MLISLTSRRALKKAVIVNLAQLKLLYPFTNITFNNALALTSAQRMSDALIFKKIQSN